MTHLISLWTACATGIGALLRYMMGRILTNICPSGFPWSTFAINILGSFLLGLLFRSVNGAVLNQTWWQILGTGFCGGFTTFSTMSSEVAVLYRKNKIRALTYVGSSLMMGILAAWMAMS